MFKLVKYFKFQVINLKIFLLLYNDQGNNFKKFENFEFDNFSGKRLWRLLNDNKLIGLFEFY